MSTKLFQLEGRKEKEWICFQELNSTLKYDWNYPTFPSNINSLLATHKNVPLLPPASEHVANVGVYFIWTSVLGKSSLLLDYILTNHWVNPPTSAT